MATVSTANFTRTIEKILEEYKEDVSQAVEAGLDEAQNYLIDQMRAASPGTGDYKSHWQKGQSDKGYRRVINDKMVEWKGKQTHLAGILEYSTKHAKPHIERTKRAARKTILQMLKESIIKGAGQVPKGE